MITLEQPSMALNGEDISWSKILMERCWNVPLSETRQSIIDWVLTIAKSNKGGKIKNLVINCHGLPGWVGIGQGFNKTHLPMFSAWNGYVQNIWFVACLVARIPDATMQADLNKNYAGYGPSDGNIFCSTLAKTVGCYVVASTEEQRNKGGYSFGQLPAFEGLLMCYNPNGGVSWSYRYPSDWAANKE
jgi:hypothetical protein